MKINILEEAKVPFYEYFYFIVMVIYAAQMTPDTCRMVGVLSGNPFPFVLPIILTCILVIRNNVSFQNRHLFIIISLAFLWSLLSIFKLKLKFGGELSFYFFLFYEIIIAYIHVKVYKEKIFPLYEDIMVKFALLSLILWIPFCLIAPSLGHYIFSIFPKTGMGYNFLYLFNWADVDDTMRIRNHGCSWEPGRYASMLVFALFCNLKKNGLKIKSNKNFWIIILSIITTTSTTGYIVSFILIAYFYIKRISILRLLGLFLIFAPICYYGSQLSFMSDKIQNSIERSSDVDVVYSDLEWGDKTSNVKIALDRIPTLVMQTENIKHDPLLGYGLNEDDSYVLKPFGQTYSFTGGLIQVISQFGIFFGFMLYFFLYKSSTVISREDSFHKLGFFICVILLSISYPVFGIPIYTAMWLYGNFIKS